ncbi:MAG: S1 RNA-binding domain-containing protein [Gimesia sp.]
MTNCGDSWAELKSSLKPGMKLTGTITRHESYGFFVAIPNVDFEGLVQITDITDEKGRLSPSDYPQVGTLIEGVVLGFQETGHEIWLGTKPSQLEQSKS